MRPTQVLTSNVLPKLLGLVLLVPLVIGQLPVPEPPSNPEPEPTSITGLPAYLIPVSYDVTVKLPLQDPFQGFSASLILSFNLTSPSESVKLHSSGLYSFRNVTLISAEDPSDPSLAGIRILKNTVEFRFQDILRAGQYLLTVGEYNGRLGNGSTGVFQRGSKFVTTHFQPSFARTLFPCVDHPSVKAPFRLTVIHPTDTVAQSNTIANDVQIVDTFWQKTVFAPTIPLPSYLIALSVMPDSFFQISRQTSFGVTLRAHAPRTSLCTRVLDHALRAFELLANVIPIPLPLNKVDFILVEKYDGGMENWGHILLSQSLAEQGDDAHLAYVIAHELAHHWIGDSCTIDNWQHICLQEDLTDYIAYKVVRELVPPKMASHCYLKGVVMLETIESVLGEESILHIIRKMVATQPHFNLTSFANLFNDVVFEGNISLSQIYEYWYLTGGFPEVRVENNVTSSLVTQETSPLWPIRLSSTTEIPPFLFEAYVELPATNAPLLLNLNFTSFYRVNYDTSTWISIFRYMNEDADLFSAIGRAQLVSDFCFFHSNMQIADSAYIREAVIEMVYSQPEKYDLCDWNLYWCHATDTSFFSSLVRKITSSLGNMFERENAFGCRNGQAARRVNIFCKGIFGRKCL